MEPIQKEDIRCNKLFQNIDFDSLLFQKLTGSTCILNYGELLYRGGEVNTSLFLVVRGEINLISSQFSSANASMIFSENDFFGVNEFISEMPRSESAIALRDSYLIEFTKDEINELIKQSDEILSNIYSAPGQTEQSFNFQNNNDVPKPVTEEEVIENSITPSINFLS